MFLILFPSQLLIYQQRTIFQNKSNLDPSKIKNKPEKSHSRGQRMFRTKAQKRSSEKICLKNMTGLFPETTARRLCQENSLSNIKYLVSDGSKHQRREKAIY